MNDNAETASVDGTETSAPPSQLLAYLQLFRAPNVFTSIADVAMGFLFVQQSLDPIGGFFAVLVASCLLYTAGMVLNDVYDFDVDQVERPSRPLPSGRISRAHAQSLGYGMLLAGVGLGWLAGYVGGAAPAWRSGAVATALAISVILYDAILKRTILGPLAMGACRFFNVLLGMSIGAVGSASVWLFDPTYGMVAGGIGTYIVGVTWFARTEAKPSSRGLLLLGVVLMGLGIAMLALFPRFAGIDVKYRIEPSLVWPAALLLLTVSLLRRCLVAVANPTPKQVQAAVKQCILSLIVLDASVCLLVCEWYWAVAILALLLPTLLLGKWVYST